MHLRIRSVKNLNEDSPDRGEPTVSYRWTASVWEITGWSSILQEKYRSLYENLWNTPKDVNMQLVGLANTSSSTDQAQKSPGHWSWRRRLGHYRETTGSSHSFQKLASQPTKPKNVPEHRSWRRRNWAPYRGFRKLAFIQWRVLTTTVRDTKYHDDVLMDFVIHMVAHRETSPPQAESFTRIRRVVRSDLVPTNRSNPKPKWLLSIDCQWVTNPSLRGWHSLKQNSEVRNRDQIQYCNSTSRTNHTPLHLKCKAKKRHLRSHGGWSAMSWVLQVRELERRWW